MREPGEESLDGRGAEDQSAHPGGESEERDQRHQGDQRVEQVALFDRREPHVPLEPVDERALGEVRRADVGGREAGLTMEQPRLGVKSRHPRLVGDLHLRAQFREPVERPSIGRPDVRRRNHPHPPTAPDEPVDVLLQDPNAVPLDERAQQIDTIGGREFVLDFDADARLVPPIHEEGAHGQRHFRSSREAHRAGNIGRRCDRL